MNWTPLIQTERGGLAECVHFGAVAVVDAGGRLLASAGDAQRLTFTRSTLKPFQALPFMEAGGAEHFGLDDPQLALLCASHNGEDRHVAQVDRLLAASRLGYKRLQCGCHTPYFVELGVKGPGAPYDERHHNCSGKHSGFLAYCALHGLPTETYTDLDHPLQQAVRKAVADVSGVESKDIAWGVDGCSAPNFAMPLSSLARAYARLATPESDSKYGNSLKLLGEAMTAHPELVSGTGRNDADLMRAGRGDWVTKVGADGVQVVASRSRGQALALKIADGNKVALFAATIEALDQLGWLDAQQREALGAWRSQPIQNIKGAQVGERRPVFQIQKA
jgi:L-asparaginase II